MKNQLTGEELSNDEIFEISTMVRHQVNLENVIAKLNAELAEKAEQLKNLAEVMIPDAMLAMGLSELKLATGETVSIKKFYSAKIPDEQQEKAFEWLRNSGNGDIIKNNIALSFGKGEDDLANEVAKMLLQKGLTPEQKIFVHPMTLKSFVKERIEAGAELPYELFGVFVGNKTKITPPTK